MDENIYNANDKANPKPGESAAPQGERSAAEARIILEDILPYLINRLAYEMTMPLEQDLRGHNLSVAQWRTLAVLEAKGRATIGELAHFAMMEQSTLSRHIDRMEKAELVRRGRTRTDGRMRDVIMTQKGIATLQEIKPVVWAHTVRALEGLGQQNADRFEALAKAMLENARSLDVAGFYSQKAGEE